MIYMAVSTMGLIKVLAGTRSFYVLVRSRVVVNYEDATHVGVYVGHVEHSILSRSGM